jgi:hypothetical protein
MWQSVQRHAGELRFDSNGHGNAVTLESLLDELRLEGAKYEEHRNEALRRFFGLREAERLRLNVDAERKRRTEAEFRQERDLVDIAALKRWMNNNDLSEHQFDTLMIDEARVKWVQTLAESASRSCLPEQLRLSGDYSRLVIRAARKDGLLHSMRMQNPRLKSVGLTYGELLLWYFEKVLGHAVPADIDKYARDLGFASPDAFRRTLLKEYLYQRYERRNETSSERFR